MIQQFTRFIILGCTQSRSVLSGYRRVQHDMLRTKRELIDSQLGANSDLGLSLDTTDTCIVHKQTNRDCVTTKTVLTKKRKTKTPLRVSKREGTASSTWFNRQSWLHSSICACHPNTVSHVSQQVAVLGVKLVIAAWSSQLAFKSALDRKYVFKFKCFYSLRFLMLKFGGTLSPTENKVGCQLYNFKKLSFCIFLEKKEKNLKIQEKI